MISEVDYDNNGYVTFEEFVPLMKRVIQENFYLEEELTQVFINFGNEKSLLTTDSLISKLIIASNDVISKGETFIYLGFKFILNVKNIFLLTTHKNSNIILCIHIFLSHR